MCPVEELRDELGFLIADFLPEVVDEGRAASKCNAGENVHEVYKHRLCDLDNASHKVDLRDNSDHHANGHADDLGGCDLSGGLIPNRLEHVYNRLDKESEKN